MKKASRTSPLISPETLLWIASGYAAEPRVGVDVRHSTTIHRDWTNRRKKLSCFHAGRRSAAATRNVKVSRMAWNCVGGREVDGLAQVIGGLYLLQGLH
ncbi:MAG: hypothetical protein ABSD75_22115 [Terriglobales bacterium]|jgi:hypothetical protein